ncbi:crossover junction endonuclease EME1 [Strongylocentrotus purpuratus]|uniref:CUE domain-containing protein n=1 Tax=Strongylocentrotus purpuratus TaxID=7668 RepID=A0A7M7NRY6_STRPU|nr:crossover junction endonuclease EME1 [Strongylocentrotus purpuratus]
MDSLVQQVLIVCPHVSADDARRDLIYTKDPQTTINRIFDGNFLIGIPTDQPGDRSPVPVPPVRHIPTKKPVPSASAGSLSDNFGSNGSERSCDTHFSEDVRDSHQKKMAYKNTQRHQGRTSPFPATSSDLHDDSDDDEEFPSIFASRGPQATSRWEANVTSNLPKESGFIPGNNEREKHGTSKGSAHDTNAKKTMSSRVCHIDISSSDSDGDQSPDKVANPVKHKNQERVNVASIVHLDPESSSDEDDIIQLGLLRRLEDQKKKRFKAARSSSQESSQTLSTSSSKSSTAREREIHEKVKNAILGNGRSYDHAVSDSDGEPESMEMTDQSSSRYNSSSMPYTTETDSLDSQTVTSQESSSSLSSGHLKTKRTPEEIQAAKFKAMERKTEKERQRQERNKLQESKKQQKQREIDQRKTLRDAKRAEKPGECLKFMTVVLDHHVIEDPCGAQILAKLQTMGCKYVIEAQSIPSCIRWQRTVLDTDLLGQDLQLDSMTSIKQEPEAIIVLSPAEFVEMVYSYKCEQRGEYTPGLRTLCDHVKDIQRQLGGIMPTLVVQGMEKYFRAKKNVHQRQYRNAVLGVTGEEKGKGKKRKRKPEDIDVIVSRVDVEEALVDVQLKLTCNMRFVETSEQIADLVAMFTKAVAETPFKRKRDEAKFSFHVHVDWAGGVKVAKDGKGLLKVWRQQFQQFRNVSPEIASAIVAQYPAPRLLLRAYKNCPTEDAAKKLLQDIVVRRGEGVLTTSRRVGPELSRRVYHLFDSTNGDLVL